MQPMIRKSAMLAAAALVAACGSSPPPGGGSASPVPGGVHSILPPGQRGVFNAADALAANAGSPPSHTDDQFRMFDALVRDGVAPGFSDDLLDTYFKRSRIEIDPDDVAREYRPAGRQDVIVRRDASFGVPYIEAETREGPAFRARFFADGIAEALADGPVTRGRLLDVAQVAATRDLRGYTLVGLLARVMGTSPPPGTDPRTAQMMQYLLAWHADGAHRLDADDDGDYEHPQAVAIMDAWWPRMIEAVFESRTGGFFAALGLPLHQAPQLGQGFAFGTGPYSHFHKDLRQVLGDPVSGRFSRSYCGGGDRAACASELWQSLAQAAADLEDEFGSADPADWQRSVQDDAIRHAAVGVVSVPPIPFQNRPTYQLVVEFR